MAGELKNILLASQGGVGTVTINRPEKLNTLSVDTLHELEQILETILEREDLRVAIITGAGDKAFIAGADISELAMLNAPQAKSFAEHGQAIFNMIENGGKPFIAAINGFALGGGCELALACAMRIASENAKVGQPEIKLGITTGFGGSQRLVRLVGKARALELCLLGEPIDARTALEWGLLTRVVPQSKLLVEAKTIAKKLGSYSPLALKYTLEAINNASDVPLAEGLSYEASLFGLSFGTEDMKEGTSAFLQKRKAQFKGK